ncbi:hypothetical protein RHS01_05603 [Rhizoctonia solani]|uniref:Uncharacterized protein n=1 Tax=Rhizoctonia solani TaxID=456999 RepID=A0A8H7M4U8_9AGAM|nr:hypothetical protein RHS01_05603 [Rhizoctonia solani]
MAWLRKKKPNPEDGDFPSIPRHYHDQEGKSLTKSIKLSPNLQWSRGATVIRSRLYLLHTSSQNTYELREKHETTEFVSHPTWPTEMVVNYVHVVGTASSPPAFQVRTKPPFIKVAKERHKCVDLVEHLLKHALSDHGAATKPKQPGWSRESDVVVSLPSGISKSAEISVVDALNRMVQRVMPKVIGETQVYYVSKPDLRPFEDDTRRNLDTNFKAGPQNWDLTTGDMPLQTPPPSRKHAASADEQGALFESSLYEATQQKAKARESGLQVGIRLIDPTVETGAFGAVLWRIAHIAASSDQLNEGDVRPVRDIKCMTNMGTSLSTPRSTESELGGSYSSSLEPSRFKPERGSRSTSTREFSVDFMLGPLPWSSRATLPATPSAGSYVSVRQANITRSLENVAGPSVVLGLLEDGTGPQIFPPAYIAIHEHRG